MVYCMCQGIIANMQMQYDTRGCGGRVAKTLPIYAHSPQPCRQAHASNIPAMTFSSPCPACQPVPLNTPASLPPFTHATLPPKGAVDGLCFSSGPWLAMGSNPRLVGVPAAWAVQPSETQRPDAAHGLGGGGVFSLLLPFVSGEIWPAR